MAPDVHAALAVITQALADVPTPEEKACAYVDLIYPVIRQGLAEKTDDEINDLVFEVAYALVHGVNTII